MESSNKSEHRVLTPVWCVPNLKGRKDSYCEVPKINIFKVVYADYVDRT